MRKVEFRIWNVKGKVMYYPFESEDVKRVDFIKDNDSVVHGVGSGHWAFCNRAEHYLWLQYTGLKDCNLKKIYEGDRIGHFHNVVEYVNGAFTVNGDRLLSDVNKKWEVLGNIYELPEPKKLRV